MSTINWFTKPTHSGSPTRSNFGSAWIKIADRIRESFWRRDRSKDLAWSTLNEHLVHDIGETRASAEIELLRSPWNAPLGTLGGKAHVEGRPLLAFRTSPLG
jgi:hypothetical protein